MLKLSVLVLCLHCAWASQKWPFSVVDDYLEEFKSNINDVQRNALNYEFKEESMRSINYDESVTLKDAEHYDFIIVGGGTSGSVIASRLSEIPEWKILLLEAGDVENDATRVPRNWELLKKTQYNWGYKTTPQNYSCLEMPDHRCVIPAGRILGGTSSINNMLYTRGHPRDYDLWADLGNKEWCYSDVLPVFKKIEDAQIKEFDKKFHRFGGLQRLQNPQYYTGLTEHVIQAGHELGLHQVDYNGKHQIGVGIPQLITDCGKRSSAANSYIKPNLERPNLIVKPLSQVLKLVISPHTKEAQGVLYLHDGHVFAAKAEKEILLSAGAIHTPKLLLLSGIGPKEDSEKLKIENLVDLTVGKELKIRPTFTGLTFIPIEPKEEKSDELDENNEIFEYLRNGKGPMTAAGVEAVAFLKSGKDKTHPADYPDIELQFVSDLHKNIVKILVTLNHPISSGFVALQDADPLHHPIIEPHFYVDEEEQDLHTMLAGIHDAIKLSHTESFKKLGLKIDHTPVEGCKEIEFGTDAYWKCAVKFLTVASGDASGTARMGHDDDHSVVDHTLKVRGMHRLRIADSSVIPLPLTGNLMGPSMMIGEKAAHMVITDWE